MSGRLPCASSSWVPAAASTRSSIRLPSPRSVDAIFAAPGNGGTAGERVTANVALDPDDAAAVVAFARENAVDLAVIGPEGPLCAGLADHLRAAGIPTVGPGAQGAQLEGSKSFAKEPHGARAHSHGGAPGRSPTRAAAAAYLETVVGAARRQGRRAGRRQGRHRRRDHRRGPSPRSTECFDGRFGEAGDTVVVEEFLEGPEVSLLAFVDGATVLPMAPAQDHKRVGDGDTGPNTGGMGVYSPVPGVDGASVRADGRDPRDDRARARSTSGIDFRGILYGGFILTAEGPKVLEYNTRFGDPETQVLLPRLETDLAEVLLALANGELDSLGGLSWSRDVAVSVVIASGGYPGDYETGKPITGIDEAAALPGVTVYHAGTSARRGRHGRHAPADASST